MASLGAASWEPAQPSIRALLFDVFGTVVDWRSSVIREGEALARRKNLHHVDWAKFADAWRRSYGPSMEKVRRAELPWTNIDALHRMILDGLLKDFQISGLSEDEINHFNRVWHRLEPWPDVPQGLLRLKKKFLIATLSNGNVALLANMAKRAALPWDVILSAELVRRYKPDPEVYRTAAKWLDVQPQEAVMVAAHKGDLKAARSTGMRTAFVPRPLEWGPQGRVDTTPDPGFDFIASDFIELAAKLGA